MDDQYIEAWERGKERGAAKGDMRRIVSERLRKIRLQHGHTQKETADLANVNHITYSGYENRISQPALDVLVRIADIYGVSLDYLAGRTDNIKGLYASENESSDHELKSRMEAIEKELENLKNKIK